MTINSNAENIFSALFILYVDDQEKSTEFYAKVLNLDPSLHVPGMTEFTLGNGCKLGLMPKKGIKNLLRNGLKNLDFGKGVLCSEVYLLVDNPEIYHQRALAHGARELSKISKREWGDVAAYSLDSDGYVLVFARSGNIN